MTKLQRTDINPTRRMLLKLAGTTVLVGVAPAVAIEPFRRTNPRIKGISLSTYSLKRHMKWWWGKPTEGTLDVLDFLEYCAKLGLDGAELTSYFFPPTIRPAYLNEIKRRAHLLGLDITGGAMGNNFAAPPGSDEAKRQLEYTRTWIDHFADIGAPVVRIFAGRGVPKGATADEIIRNVKANLAEALVHAERRGVMLGMENHDFVKNVDYLLQIVKDVDSKWFGVVWDSANLMPTRDPYADLARIAPYALVAQLKVTLPVDGKPVPADFGRLVKVLRDAGYSGYLVLEYEEAEDPYAAIPKYVRQLRDAL